MNLIMKKTFLLSLSVLALMLTFTSCKKDKAPDSPTKQALMAHTWQMETVTGFSAGVPNVTYQRGASNNEEDFSMIRQTYKSNGTIQWVDEFGDSGSNATYSLLDNDTKIRLSYSGLSATGENLVVTSNQFAYTLKYNSTDSTRFVFSPL
jgi:hypothetical protein